MFTNKAPDNRNNLCGRQVARYRKAMTPYVSQNKFAQMLQLQGLNLDKNAIQRIESGERFVTDIELEAIARTLGVSADQLLAQDGR